MRLSSPFLRHSELGRQYAFAMNQQNSKDLGDEANEMLRAFVRRLVDDSDQTQTAELLGISQGYLSEFLSSKRGGGGRIVMGLARLDPRQLIVALGGIAPTGGGTIGADLESVARSILKKRGWGDGEIDAVRDATTITRLPGAENAFVLANVWERALRGELVEGIGPTPAPAKLGPEEAERPSPVPPVLPQASSPPEESEIVEAEFDK